MIVIYITFIMFINHKTQWLLINPNLWQEQAKPPKFKSLSKIRVLKLTRFCSFYFSNGEFMYHKISVLLFAHNRGEGFLRRLPLWSFIFLFQKRIVKFNKLRNIKIRLNMIDFENEKWYKREMLKKTSRSKKFYIDLNLLLL